MLETALLTSLADCDESELTCVEEPAAEDPTDDSEDGALLRPPEAVGLAAGPVAVAVGACVIVAESAPLVGSGIGTMRAVSDDELAEELTRLWICEAALVVSACVIVAESAPLVRTGIGTIMAVSDDELAEELARLWVCEAAVG